MSELQTGGAHCPDQNRQMGRYHMSFPKGKQVKIWSRPEDGFGLLTINHLTVQRAYILTPGIHQDMCKHYTGFFVGCGVKYQTQCRLCQQFSLHVDSAPDPKHVCFIFVDHRHSCGIGIRLLIQRSNLN